MGMENILAALRYAAIHAADLVRLRENVEKLGMKLHDAWIGPNGVFTGSVKDGDTIIHF